MEYFADQVIYEIMTLKPDMISVGFSGSNLFHFTEMSSKYFKAENKYWIKLVPGLDFGIAMPGLMVRPGF